MAFCKDIEIDTGVITTYHRIGKIDINYKEKSTKFAVEMYLSKDARDNGKTFIETKRYYYEGESFTFDVSQPLVEQLYDKLKLEDEWNDATDC
jgi:hypothetical protein